MNEELVQSIRGNTDDIQKDNATINLLPDKIPIELRHLPIASIAGIEVIRDFKAFNEIASYNPSTKKFSGVGINMCLPWADGAAKSKLTEIISHTQLVEAVQVLQEVLEGVWQKQSHSIFGPWFSDLREEFDSTTFVGAAAAPPRSFMSGARVAERPGRRISVRADAAIAAAHARFEVINNELKQLITDWQTRSIGGLRLDDVPALLQRRYGLCLATRAAAVTPPMPLGTLFPHGHAPYMPHGIDPIAPSPCGERDCEGHMGGALTRA
jgi:hypothetical protein